MLRRSREMIKKPVSRGLVIGIACMAVIILFATGAIAKSSISGEKTKDISQKESETTAGKEQDDAGVDVIASDAQLISGEDAEAGSSIAAYESDQDSAVSDDTAEASASQPVVDLSNGYVLPEYTAPDRTVHDSYYSDASERNVYIYNSIALDRFLGYKSVSKDEIDQEIDDSEFHDEQKAVVKEFVHTIMEYYPGIDMRIFYENLKNLFVVDISKLDRTDSGNTQSEAEFNYWYSTLYLPDDMDLSPGSHDLMVFRHELGHMLNLGRFMKSSRYLICSFENKEYGHFIQEGADVIVTAYPFEDEYEEENLGIPLVSNELRLILEATPGFDPRDLVGKNIDWLEGFLDENNASDVSGHDILYLMEEQCREYYGQDTLSEEHDYSLIYEYIADLYIHNVFYDTMSDGEAENYKDHLNYELTKCLRSYEVVKLDAMNEKLGQYILARDNNSQ